MFRTIAREYGRVTESTVQIITLKQHAMCSRNCKAKESEQWGSRVINYRSHLNTIRNALKKEWNKEKGKNWKNKK